MPDLQHSVIEAYSVLDRSLRIAGGLLPIRQKEQNRNPHKHVDEVLDVARLGSSKEHGVPGGGSLDDVAEGKVSVVPIVAVFRGSVRLSLRAGKSFLNPKDRDEQRQDDAPEQHVAEGNPFPARDKN